MDAGGNDETRMTAEALRDVYGATETNDERRANALPRSVQSPKFRNDEKKAPQSEDALRIVIRHSGFVILPNGC